MSLEQIDVIGIKVAEYTSEEIRQQVLAGREGLKPSTKPEKVALWMQSMLERMDHALDEETRNRVMTECGHGCIAHNPAALKQPLARRKKFSDFQSFLNAEIDQPQRGYRFERDGDALIQYYVPESFRPGTRCFCSLVKALPAEQTISATYCQCSRGFVEKFWEALYGSPVQVELLESAVSGAKECKFRIRFE